MLIISEGIEAAIPARDEAPLPPPVGRIEQEGQRHFKDRRHLARIWRQPIALRQKPHHRLDVEAGAGEIAVEIARHGDEAWRDTGFFHCFAQRRLYG